MDDKTKKNIVQIVCITIIILAVLFILWYMFASTHPAIAIFRFEMDNNTLEVARLVSK